MMDKQESILRMYYTVCAVCDTNIEIWQENEVFAASYRKFQKKIPEIQRYCEILKMEVIASESFKRIDRIELEEMGFYISGKLLAVVKNTANNDLHTQISSNRHNLLKSDDNELVTICTNFSQHAFVFADQLTEQGLSAEDLAEFQQFIIYFSSNMNRVRHYAAKNKSSQEILKRLFKETEEILKKRLDSDIDFFKNSDPDFCNQYNAAREVVNFEHDHMLNFSEKLFNYIN